MLRFTDTGRSRDAAVVSGLIIQGKEDSKNHEQEF